MHFYNAFLSKTYPSFFRNYFFNLLPRSLTLAQETSTGTSKCSESQILSTPYHDIYEVLSETPINAERDKCMVNTYDFTMPWEMTDDKVQSVLTEFMVWASLTRDMEMQKGKLVICMRRSVVHVHVLHRTHNPSCSPLHALSALHHIIRP